MLQHEAAAHSAEPEEHPCTALNCTKVFKAATALEQHFSAVHILAELSVVIDPQHFWCFCNRQFKNFEDLRRHHRDTHQEGIGQYESSLFSTSTNSSYMCSCSLKFDDFDVLRDHHSCVHQPETPSTTTIAINPFPCTYDKCKRSFNSSGGLLKHMVSGIYSRGKLVS